MCLKSSSSIDVKNEPAETISRGSSLIKGPPVAPVRVRVAGKAKLKSDKSGTSSRNL